MAPWNGPKEWAQQRHELSLLELRDVQCSAVDTKVFVTLFTVAAQSDIAGLS